MSLSILRKNRKILHTIGILCIWLAVFGAIAGSIFLIYIKYTLPDPESISSRKLNESTKIYDRTGTVLLYDIYAEEKRTVIPWEQVPDSIKKATLAAEDSEFYTHRGFDFRGIARSILKDLTTGSFSQGGSTITQQLIKNALLGDQRQNVFSVVTRKIRELFLSMEVEQHFTKDEIFWMYLNQIPYGSNAYGIQSASRTFFDKDAADLTIAQAALLASLPQAPSYYSPFGSHQTELFQRQHYVLERMKTLGYITDAEYQTALGEKIEFKSSTTAFSAPHFVLMIKDYLVSKYGEQAVQNGGFKITTTLDADLQQSADAIVKKYVDINATKYKATNAGLVAIDPKTGDVLVLVGSKDYFDVGNQGNFNIATAKRQPGSAFKPFAYATALAKGYPDSTIIFDTKTEFNPNCLPDSSQTKDQYGLDCYHPQNYDGKYRGPVTLRQAIDQSLNVPSVKVLYLAGVQDTINTAEQMGITTLGANNFGLSLVLGGAEVKLIDITSAYGVFANDGVRNPWSIIQKIELNDGTVLEQKDPSPQRAISSQTARLMNDILSDNQARGPVFGYNSSLYFPGIPVAAKTGTTQNNRDAWIIGYNPVLVSGVWVGNNDNTPMTKEGAGISAAGPMWHEFMLSAFKKISPEDFIKPDPVVSSKPMLNGDYHYQPSPSSPVEVHNILQYVSVSDPLGPMPSNPSADPQYNNWEWSVQHNFVNTSF